MRRVGKTVASIPMIYGISAMQPGDSIVVTKEQAKKKTGKTLATAQTSVYNYANYNPGKFSTRRCEDALYITRIN